MFSGSVADRIKGCAPTRYREVVLTLPKPIHDWTGSVQGAVATWSNDRSQESLGKYRMLITDQVATAPCTDPVQVSPYGAAMRILPRLLAGPRSETFTKRSLGAPSTVSGNLTMT